jgi:hypothetical protein
MRMHCHPFRKWLHSQPPPPETTWSIFLMGLWVHKYICTNEQRSDDEIYSRGDLAASVASNHVYSATVALVPLGIPCLGTGG